MAAAQLNHATMVPDLNASSQHSVKAMLIQKHLNELEKYQINKNNDETNSDIDVDSPNDSGCEARNNKRAHTPSEQGDSVTSTDESAPYCKMPRMIDVETVDNDQAEQLRAPAPTANRNVFSIRNLIYTKDTSDSESAESEDSGNVNSSSGSHSPNSNPDDNCWRPDPAMLHRLKQELVQTLHTFVDTVVSDVVAKVATNYNDLNPRKSQKSKKKKNMKRKTSADSSNDSSNGSSQIGISEKSFSTSPSDIQSHPQQVITKFEPGTTPQLNQQITPPSATSAPHLAPGAAQARLSPMPGAPIHSINQFGRQPTVNPIRPAPHHTVALQQQAALNAVRQNPLFLQRDNRQGLYPYLSSQGYPYGTSAPVNALLQQQDYRRSFLHIDPITGRIKNDDEYDHSIFGGAPQEGLTPHHLKKAKLMFFYCRYPSSNVLKTYFPDVKFNRATTSQLIKWFSNFREFFYIQIEKYARQALSEGITDPADLRVSRDCDMFKALNNHYNKTNEFEVPDEFLECSLTSLREFFTNIKEGRDADPSWKKAIYKIICKSDTEIPESFKSATFLTDVAH